MKCTVTKKNIFNTLNEVILYGVILLVIIIYLWTEFNPKEYGNTIFLVYGLLIFFYLVVVFIPVIVLFFNYYKQNKDDVRSEEHTSELQSRENLVCRLLLEKK